MAKFKENTLVMLLNFLFIFLIAIATSLVTMSLSPLWLPDNMGLAGGATVLFYGLLGLIGGLIPAIVFRNKVPASTKKWTIGLLTSGLIIWIVWAVYFN